MKTISPNQDNSTILIELYYEISGFVRIFRALFERHLLGERRRRPFCRLEVFEIMTILIAYQIIGGQNSESFCKDIIWQFHRREFPCLAAYQRSVGIAPVIPVPLVLFPEFRMETGAHTGICVIGPTPPRVCPNLRIPDTKFPFRPTLHHDRIPDRR